MTLKPGLGVTESHRKFIHSIDSLWRFYSDYGPISCIFWDTQCRPCHWPWPVKGQSM